MAAQKSRKKPFNLKSRAVCLKDDEICIKMSKALENQLNYLESRRVDKIIILTHFIPLKDLVRYQNDLPMDYFTAFTGCEVIEAVISNYPTICYLLFGHSHFKCDRTVGSIRALSGPIGYLDTVRQSDLGDIAEERLGTVEI
jgi:hypothetical protein